ncbi:hypothetical protein T4D_16169 [Trichinella pseudospiralis]|uniref:Uncharacterized protein n=1 Tax=Trichinella pseudospiralis TaxID=6337 RepID=A0A0V1FKB1_TRIPS|nr:hypothetical protein T4D_16169 [Trichinella pseudospiralis]
MTSPIDGKSNQAESFHRDDRERPLVGRVHTQAYDNDDNDNDNDNDNDVGQSSDEKLKQLESSRYVLECPDCVGQWSRSKTGGAGDQPGQTRPNQTKAKQSRAEQARGVRPNNATPT